MDNRSRRADGLSPGNDPVSLWIVTSVVLAGLILTGMQAPRDRLLTGPVAGARVTTRAQVVASPAASADGPGQAAAREMLAQAASASNAVAYWGWESLHWWGAGGANTSVVEVWHEPGEVTLTTTMHGTAGLPPNAVRIEPQAAADGGPGLVGGLVLGMSQRAAALIGANYALAVTGRGLVAGRPASIVTARQPGGGLAARFWLDSVTHLLLRRQVFGARSRVSDVAFLAVKLGRGAVTEPPAPAARAWGDRLAAAQLARLRAEGWPLPGPLPGHLTLLSARQDTTGSGRVVDLDYSDGLSLISIFVQRGHLPPQLSGWSQVAMQGHQVYSDDPDDLSVAWSARGYVYTVISAAPRQTVGQVVAALPHDAGPGVLSRIQHGLRRLLSWVSP